ncbi:helix-turn-helix transcriptional regulator [bacterium]|nr:helix-turn-helix transcriptional regulator [bacterium]
MPAKSKERNIIQKSLGYVVKSLRNKLHLTQEQLAEKANVHRTFIADLEAGGRNIAIRNFLRLSTALEIQPDKMMRLLIKQLNDDNKDFDLKEYLEKSKWVERG